MTAAARTAMPRYTHSDAVVDEPYRYLLWRRWEGDGPYVTFVMLNPSTADARRDDNTIRRCVRFAQAWGFSGINVVNLFAFRATRPIELHTVSGVTMAATELAVIGPDNAVHLDDVTRDAVAYTDPPTGPIVVAGWGTHGGLYNRGDLFLSWMAAAGRPVHYLVRNADGSPRHPLYVKGVTRPTLYRTDP